jgi:hypothetical protein
MSTIVEAYGLMNFIIHPDYIMGSKAQSVYKALLQGLNQLQSEKGVWQTLPAEVDRWWRQRSEMKLVGVGQNWKIEGQGSDRATVAYARLSPEGLIYDVLTNPLTCPREI